MTAPRHPSPSDPEELPLEADEADVEEQREPVGEVPVDEPGPIPVDVPEADALEQAIEVPVDEEAEPR